MNAIFFLYLTKYFFTIYQNLETVSEVGRIKDFNGEAFVLLNSVHKKSKLSQAFVKHLKIMIENLNNVSLKILKGK